MQELRVLLETKQPINDEIRSAWFLLPIDEEELQERLGVFWKKNCPLLMMWAKIRPLND